MSFLSTYFSSRSTVATVVLVGFVLCTVHIGVDVEGVTTGHHSAPHTAQCVDTCIDHVPVVPTIHARVATSGTQETPDVAQNVHVLVQQQYSETLLVAENSRPTQALSKLYIHFSVLRV